MLRLRTPARAVLLLVLLPGLITTRTVEAQVIPSFVPGRILVGFHPEVTPSRVEAILTAVGARSLGQKIGRAHV